MSRGKIPVLILHASGTNRDGEAARACQLAGGRPEIVHINQLRAGAFRLCDYGLVVLPGGFSYGDALGAGVRQALDLQIFFRDQMQEYVSSGRMVLGICNGFQTLVKAGLLPGGDGVEESAHAARGTAGGQRAVTLTYNQRRRFECRWVHLKVETGACAGFLAGLDEPIFCPVAHGEGNLQVASSEDLERLEKANLIAFRYADRNGNPAAGRYPTNPNGSAADIAGLCNPQGNVLGLMPHPEDHVDSIQNPLGGTGGLGLALFEAMLAKSGY